MADKNKCIGKLTLDISDIDAKVKDINNKLSQIGVGKKIDLSRQVASEVKKQLKAVEDAINKSVKNIQDAAQRASGAFSGITKQTNSGSLSSEITKTTSLITTLGRSMDAAGNVIETVISETKTGLNDVGQKIREVTDSSGNITRKVVDMSSQYKEALKVLTEYYTKIGQMYNLEQTGKTDTPKYTQLVSEVNALNEAWSKIPDGVRSVVLATEDAQRAAKLYNDTVAAVDKGTTYKEQKENADRYKVALLDLIKAQADFNNAVATGKIKEGTEKYKEAEDNIKRLETASINAAQKVTASDKQVVEATREVSNAYAMLKTSEAALNDSNTTNYLQTVTDAYNRLREAVNQYGIAKKSHNDTNMNIWQNEIEKQMGVIDGIDKIIGSLQIEENEREQIRIKIEQAKTLNDGFQKGVIGTTTATGELESQVKGLVTRYLSLVAVIRTISSLMENMVEYVSAYSDKMTEIQMITLKTDEEVARLGETYRNIAADMNVSSLDMADAAIYFTRQGLAAEEIERRLKNVTMYAKAANVEFKDAAEIMTAVINSMGLVEQEAEDGRNAAQRVADVFLKIGDNAATSGQEIGEAMQKAAASAGAFGVSMEWLASYIAAVSETTRQEARTIGTAFNTIIARLHQIKTTGYNQEDETKVNDIAKALHKVDIELMDQHQNWRNMEDILIDIALKWDTMNDKTRSYIATTMAGVKQQNVFLALMNDMSKSVDGNSRAFELHELAMNSDGVAAEKYEKYLDGVTAAQERLTVAQENFYALLGKDIIKNWYDMLAGIINWITDATEAFGGMNIIIPVVAGSIYLLIVAIGKLNVKLAEAGGILNLISAHPVIFAITAVTVGIAALTGAASMFTDKSKDMLESFNNANKALEESQRNLQRYRDAQDGVMDMFVDFRTKVELTSEDFVRYNGLLEELCNISPIARDVVDQLKEGFITQEEAAQQLNNELERLIKNEKEVNINNLMDRYASYAKETNNKDAARLITWMDSYEQYGTEGYKKLDPAEKFAYSLRNASHHHDLSEELQLEIEDMLEHYLDMDIDENEAWKRISQRVSYKLFGKFEIPDNYAQNMADEVNREIDYAISMIGEELDPVEQIAVRKSLYDKIFGSDGELSASEYETFAHSMFSWLMDFDKYGLDYILNQMSDLEMAKQIAESLFDPEEIGDMFEISEDMQEGFASRFVESFRKLVLSGFSEQDIKEIYEDIPKAYWDNAAGVVRDQLENSLKTVFGTDTLGDYIPLFDGNGELLGMDLDELMWGDIDLKTMRDILDMAQEGMITIQDVQKLMSDANGDIDVFKQSLVDYGASVGFVVEDADDSFTQHVATLKEMQDAVKEARQDIDTIEAALSNLREGKSVKFEDLLDLATAHPEIMNVINDTEKLKEALESLRSEAIDDFGAKVGELIWNSADMAQGIAKSQGYNILEGETLSQYKKRLEEGGAWQEAESIVAFVNAAVDALKLAREELDASTDTWLASQAEKIEQQKKLNYAEATGYEEQVHALQQALEEGGEAGAEKARTYWNALDSEIKEGIAKTYPGLIVSMNNLDGVMKNEGRTAEDLKHAMNGLNSELTKSEKFATAKHFTDAYAAIQKLENGTISATDAYEVFDKELNKVTKAYEDILDVQNKMAYNADPANKDKQPQDIDAGDVSNLANMIGWTAEEVLDDFPAAIDMFNELTGASGELMDMLNMLNDAAFIKITGTSDADFSAIEAGLIYVQNLADDAVEKLLATGQWEVDTIKMDQKAALWNWDNNDKTAGHWSYPETIVGAEVLRPTNNNPFKGKSSVNSKSTKSTQSKGRSSGGGGGGGNNSFRDTNVNTEVERMLDMMSQVNSIQSAQQSWYQTQQKYYAQTGRIQGVIAYMHKERDAIEAQNPVLEKNIEQIEKYMETKKAEIATLSTDDEAYKEVADDLDKLQKAHQTYSKELISNKTAIEQLTQAMEEQRKKIRQMEINLRNTILQAIEDREKKQEDMFNAEIQMENTILELIKRRYEKERDHILETTNMKIDSLQQERDLLDEQLRIRKAQAEEEDKALKLRELEAKYQRIIADPTRLKEAQSLKKEIEDLRKEMAWDLAEKEVEAQKDSIDQQITSLEDYQEYIENYYEDLFEHPQKLIDEMRQIILGTQEEIMKFLKDNDDAYKNASENTQIQMVQGWADTYNEMKGILQTYWDEVEWIIEQGDDYIIQFLMDNSANYAKAGKLQAEAYVDEWKEQLKNLKKAYEDVAAEVAASYATIAQSTYQASNKSGGGGGGGSGSSGGNHGYSFKYGGHLYEADGFATKEAADAAMKGAVSAILRVGAGTMASSSMIGQGIRAVQQSATVYKQGGLADYTGLAWLDGTKTDPERVLSPYQTRLFESMVGALENIDKIMIPSMFNYGNLQTSGGTPVSVGDIIVNVDNLDTDDDYEEMADKVCEILMNRIGRTSSIGGLRIRSV